MRVVRCYAAAAHIPGFVHVSPITTLPQRLYSGSPGTRKSIKLLVAVRAGVSPNVVRVLTGSRFERCPRIKTFCNKAGTAAKDFTAPEYIHHLPSALGIRALAVRQHRTMDAPVLVHDRSPVHTCKDVTGWLRQQGVQSVLLPPRSPDLSPPDYGIFGTVKRELYKLIHKPPRMAWDPACRWFVRRLEEFDNSRVLAQLPLRLQACIDAEGGHIEGRLRRLR